MNKMKQRLKCKWDISSALAEQGIWPDSTKDKEELITHMVNSRRSSWPYNTSEVELNKLVEDLKISANL